MAVELRTNHGKAHKGHWRQPREHAKELIVEQIREVDGVSRGIRVIRLQRQFADCMCCRRFGVVVVNSLCVCLSGGWSHCPLRDVLAIVEETHHLIEKRAGHINLEPLRLQLCQTLTEPVLAVCGFLGGVRREDQTNSNRDLEMVYFRDLSD